jgi:hypothetical protein
MGDDESTNDASNDVVEEPAEDPILSALETQKMTKTSK